MLGTQPIEIAEWEDADVEVDTVIFEQEWVADEVLSVLSGVLS